MLNKNIHSKALTFERERISKLFRDTRKAYNITLQSMAVHSDLSVNTLRVIEGSKPGKWTIDTHIIYQLSLITLIKSAKEYDYVSKNYPAYNVDNIANLLIK